MSSTVPDPQALAAIVAQVKEVFATLFIGFAVATTAYGISVLQCYRYYRNYPKDSLYLKLTVGTLWILDTLSTILVAHALYTFFVLNFGDLAADGFIPWSFALENGILTLVTIIAQCFYSWQIWRVSGSILVTAGILLLAVISLGLGFYITYHLFHFPTIASIAANVFRAVTGTVQGTAAACDIAITLALICYLHSGRVKSGIRSTERMIDKLIVYAVCRGILTAIAQIMFLALNVSLPHRTLWQPFHQAVGKLYVNSVVASLNARNTVRGAGNLQKSGGNSKSWSMPTMRTSGSTGRPNELRTVEDYEAHDDDDKHQGFPRFATGPIEPCHLKPI